MRLGAAPEVVFHYRNGRRREAAEVNPARCFSHGLSPLVFRSEDLEDPDHRAGLPWGWRLHGQRLHEDAGALARAGGIRAVSSPAYPHQGGPQTAPCSHRYRMNEGF